jgi:hypothetical protein
MQYALNFAIETKRDLETFQKLEKLKAAASIWWTTLAFSGAFWVGDHDFYCCLFLDKKTKQITGWRRKSTS